jgi:hypothetical protein
MKKPGAYRVIMMAAVVSAFTLTYAASAANIGFVAGLTGGALDQPFDIGWANRLTMMGYTVTPIDQTTAASAPLLSTMDLFIVSSDVASGTVLTGVGINQPKPYIVYEYGLWDEIFGGTGQGTTAGSGNTITILQPSSPLAAGLSGDVSIYTGGGGGSRQDLTGTSAGTQVIARSTSNPTLASMLLLEPGQQGGTGQGGTTIWSSRRIGVPSYADWDPTLVSANGWKLLDNAVAYAVPEPSTFALLGLGMGMAFFLARRQRR